VAILNGRSCETGATPNPVMSPPEGGTPNALPSKWNKPIDPGGNFRRRQPPVLTGIDDSSGGAGKISESFNQLPTALGQGIAGLELPNRSHRGFGREADRAGAGFKVEPRNDRMRSDGLQANVKGDIIVVGPGVSDLHSDAVGAWLKPGNKGRQIEVTDLVALHGDCLDTRRNSVSVEPKLERIDLSHGHVCAAR